MRLCGYYETLRQLSANEPGRGIYTDDPGALARERSRMFEKQKFTEPKDPRLAGAWRLANELRDYCDAHELKGITVSGVYVIDYEKRLSERPDGGGPMPAAPRVATPIDERTLEAMAKSDKAKATSGIFKDPKVVEATREEYEAARDKGKARTGTHGTPEEVTAIQEACEEAWEKAGDEDGVLQYQLGMERTRTSKVLALAAELVVVEGADEWIDLFRFMMQAGGGRREAAEKAREAWVVGGAAQNAQKMHREGGEILANARRVPRP